MLPEIGTVRPWTDPEIVSIGRLPMRSPLVAHATVEAARAGDRGASPWWRSLDGDWSFRLYDHPDSVDADAVGIDDAPLTDGWRAVAVPGNWTLQGTGDVPHLSLIHI